MILYYVCSESLVSKFIRDYNFKNIGVSPSGKATGSDPVIS